MVHSETAISLTYMQSSFGMSGKRRTFRMICDEEYPRGLRPIASRNSAASVIATKGVVASEVAA